MTNQEEIFGPFLALRLLTMIVWFYMYSQHLPFLLGYIEKHKEEGLTMEEIGDHKSHHYFAKIHFPTATMHSSDNLKAGKSRLF